EPFRPIAAGHQWWQSRSLRSFELESVLAEDGASGVNLVRLWDPADFALGVEGAQPVWLQEGTTWGAARGVAVATADVRTGLRAAAPTPGSGRDPPNAAAAPH